MTGTLLLTFDDRHVAGWEEALPLFEAAGARVTFFVVEADLLDDAEQAGVRRLLAAGHSVGSHGARHRNADEAILELGAAEYLRTEITGSVAALRSLGASASSFAYPNSRRDETTDAVLLEVFDHLRGGSPRTTDLGVARASIVPRDAKVFPGRGIDTGRGGVPQLNDAVALSELLGELAEGDGTLVLYAHEIAPVGRGNHIHPDRLHAVLIEARRLGLRMVGFDDYSPASWS
ncbi:polysaccharide deacetylase family protein [Kribbella sp. NPDC059898]|uniref:polysaccharide deacetylase family protein n=1 Tax=Kribbella sp. NPDC059898 TaxID=3346995 RepID=UPI00365EC57D